MIISGHFETDSVEPKLDNLKETYQYFKIQAFKKITEEILSKKPKFFYIIGDFNFEFDNIVTVKDEVLKKLIFPSDLYLFNTNTYDEMPFTSYEEVTKSDVKQKNIDYLITKKGVNEIILPIYNNISYNIISKTGTDHKLVSFIKIDLNKFINAFNNISDTSTINNIIDYLYILQLWNVDDSTNADFPSNIQIKTPVINI